MLVWFSKMIDERALELRHMTDNFKETNRYLKEVIKSNNKLLNSNTRTIDSLEVAVLDLMEKIPYVNSIIYEFIDHIGHLQKMLGNLKGSINHLKTILDKLRITVYGLQCNLHHSKNVGEKEFAMVKITVRKTAQYVMETIRNLRKTICDVKESLPNLKLTSCYLKREVYNLKGSMQSMKSSVKQSMKKINKMKMKEWRDFKRNSTVGIMTRKNHLCFR